MTDFLKHWAEQSEANARLVAQETLITEVTEAIWQAMEEAGINKAELARRLGTTKGYITQVLNGSRNMTLRTLSDICFVLACKPGFYLKPKISMEEWDAKQNQNSSKTCAELS